MRISILIVVLALMTACAGAANNNAETQKITLPSGRQISRPSMQKTSFQNGDVALVLNYETDIPIEESARLREEIQDVWSLFQKDVEGAQLKVGIIRATKFESGGMVRSGKTHGFVFTKRDDGHWDVDGGENKKTQ